MVCALKKVLVLRYSEVWVSSQICQTPEYLRKAAYRLIGDQVSALNTRLSGVSARIWITQLCTKSSKLLALQPGEAWVGEVPVPVGGGRVFDSF